jgi:hypothetical protein
VDRIWFTGDVELATMRDFDGGQRGRERGFGYDMGGAREREQEAKETPEQAAAKRVELLWHAADSAAQRATKLSGIALRKEWRIERDALRAKHQGLKEELKTRSVDAQVSERSRTRYEEAAAKVETIGEELEHVKEPRPVPPVRGEVELEPSVIERSAPPERLLTWVAGLDARERQAVVDRLVGVGGGTVDREDGFAVTLANYFGDLGVRKAYMEWAKAAGVKVEPGLRARFLSVAKDPRHGVTREPGRGGRRAVGPNIGSAAVPSSPHPHQADGPRVGTAPSSSSPSAVPVQRAPVHTASGTTNARPADPASAVAPPEAGIDKPGFIDNFKGAPVYTAPAEAGGVLVRDAPLPPAARVFASGTHPKLKHWWYVTAYLNDTMLRGYVEAFRVNVDLPEPLAELRQLDGGETPEGLAKEKFGGAVRDGPRPSLLRERPALREPRPCWHRRLVPGSGAAG